MSNSTYLVFASDSSTSTFVGAFQVPLKDLRKIFPGKTFESIHWFDIQFLTTMDLPAEVQNPRVWL